MGTLISMATDSSHRAKMGEHLVSTLALSVFIGSSLFLQVHVRRTTIIPQYECKKKGFRISKSDIRSQLEYQKSISNVKV